MRILDNASMNDMSTNKIQREKRRASPKPGEVKKVSVLRRLSPEEVRAKIEKRQQEKESEAVTAPQLPKHMKSPLDIFKKESEVKKGKNSQLPKTSDINLNDPNDSNTQEKLKAHLRNGSFSFSNKERQALRDILGN